MMSNPAYKYVKIKIVQLVQQLYYGLGNQGIVVRFLAQTKDLYLAPRFLAGSRTHRATHSLDTDG